MEKYILFHGSEKNFDFFDMTKIDYDALKYQGNSGNIFGFYFLGFDNSINDDTEKFKELFTKTFKDKIHGYISKQNQFTEGFIYQIIFEVEKSNLLSFNKLTLNKDEIIKIIEYLYKKKLDEQHYREFVSTLKNDVAIYKYLCSLHEPINVVTAFKKVNKFGIINMSAGWGTMIIFDDSKLVISHKKYVNLLNEKENKIIF